MTVDYPAAGAIAGLRALWKEAFGDSDLFLDAFFARGFSPDRCRCITENGTVLAALYWFEATCKGQRFAYLYAIATAASHRGKGLFSALLADTKAVLEKAGFDGILLVPENEPLSRMYEKFGFTACTAVDAFSAVAAQEAVPLREIGPEEFSMLRRQYLPAGGVVQEGENLRFLASYAQFYAGADFVLALSGQEGVELLGNREKAPGIPAALGLPAVKFRTPGGDIPFAMFLPLQENVPTPKYFGLAFD